MTAEPRHLLVQQGVFAGDRFWAALNRLADSEGHTGHHRYLAGEVVATERYRLWCVPCDQAVVTMQVQRTDPA